MDRLYVLTFLVLFVNVSVINQYLNIENLGGAKIELSEEEESEDKEVEEEVKALVFEENTLLQSFKRGGLKYAKIIENRVVLIENYFDVFTPPPELG